MKSNDTLKGFIKPIQKFFKKTPEKSKIFRDRYGGVISPISTVKFLCHCISFYVAFKVTKEYAVNNTTFYYTAITLTVLGLFLIEFLFSVVSRAGIRQLLNLEFKSVSLIFMFFLCCILNYYIYLLSYNLSSIGGETKMIEYVGTYEKVSHNALVVDKNKELKTRSNQHKKEEEVVNKNHDNQITAIEKTYKGLIGVKNKEYTQHKKNKSKGYKWADSWMDKVQKEKRRLNKKRITEIQNVNDSRMVALQSVVEKRIKNNNEVTTRYDALIDEHNNLESKKLSENEAQKKLYGSIGFAVGGWSVIACFFLSFLKEMIIKSGDIKEKEIVINPEGAFADRMIGITKQYIKSRENAIVWWYEDFTKTDQDKDGFQGNPVNGVLAMNMSVEEKDISAVVPIEKDLSPTANDTHSQKRSEKPTTHSGTGLEGVERGAKKPVVESVEEPVVKKRSSQKTTVEESVVTTVEEKPVTTVDSSNLTTVGTTVEPVYQVVLNQGLPYVIFNGKKRDAGWIAKSLASYVAKKADKIKRGKPHTNEDSKIEIFTDILKQLKKPKKGLKYQ